MVARTLPAAIVAALLVAGCGDDPEPRTLLEFPDAEPGDVIALRTDPDAAPGDAVAVEWIDRRAGTIRAVTVDDGRTVGEPRVLATVEVSTDGEQRGLLGHAVVDDVRYATWTEPGTDDLVVGAVDRNGAGRIVWYAGGTSGGAVGGHLEAGPGGELVIGLGQLTDWAKEHGSGALVALDPSEPADQEPVVLSDGYTNPFAFAFTDDGLWVADNAVGTDSERIGRGDLADRDGHATTGVDPRAPSALVVLDDGDLGVCGFLDGELRRWAPDGPDGRSGTSGDPLGPCRTGATVLPDGSVVTAAEHATGVALVLLQ